ncbi:MAG: LysM peptidoglycan-binding domain-containing protein [Leptolyngbyaceae cyanobacterium CRU_2_3]|nr:LysM peptidoglycan-binding domain-containing protein [Leptolyngbyaceae cyanobacterium CRU_2_3]
MKRAFLRKVKPVSCSPHETAGQPEHSPTGVHRRARTSAAMFGLALSMGASSLVLPHHDDAATAAEPRGTEATVPSVSQVATLPTSVTESATIAPAIAVVEHVVREGQTLSQIARSYRVNVQDIIAANHLTTDATVKPGQTLKIPVNRQFDVTGKVAAPELLASANLNQISLAQQASATASPAAVDRDTALNRLREQRNKLRDSLAGLRSEGLSGAASSGEAGKANIATLPPSMPPTAAETPVKPETVTYQVQAGDTLAAIARSHGVSQRDLLAANNLANPDRIRVSDSLSIPTSQAAMSSGTPLSTLPVQVAEALPNPTTLPPSTVQEPVHQNVALASQLPTQLQEYRVSPGDTVAEIAREHNIPQSMLVNTNRLSDPNVIFVGQVLRVPSTQPQVPAIVEASPAQPVAILPRAVNLPDANPVPVVPATVSTNNTSSDRPSGISTKANSLEIPEAVQSTESPRYVENLLAEVRALRAKHQVDPTAQPDSTDQPTVVAARIEAPAVPTAMPLSTFSARPQYSTSRANPAPVPQSPVSVGQPSVVATAPIGSENYAPLRQPITGRTVSPDLPPLAGAEAYLPEGARSNGYIWPARGLLTSGYGWRWGRMHQGIDIAADVGTPVYAAATGVVEYSDWNSGGYGNMVDIRHPDGSITRYAHLNRSLVREGQRVRQGEQIAEMGSTGYSTGPHLHFEVRPAGGGAANPIAFLPAQ